MHAPASVPPRHAATAATRCANSPNVTRASPSTRKSLSGVARARLAKTEEAHLELVRSYRELNDRHIRLRQKAETAGQPSDTNAGDKPKVRLI